MKLALDPQMFYATHPVHELPDVVARMGYTFMELSPKADYITGASIFVDGGMTLYPGFEAGG